MSPVIGMVLILAISVLGIVAVTNWGLPAIIAMQQNVETRSVLNDFTALDASMQKLIAGTTGQTTFKWQPAIGQGAVDVDPKGQRWLVAADVEDNVTVEWEDASDDDNVFNLTGAGPLPNPVRVQAWTWDGGVATEVILRAAQDSCPNPQQAWSGNLGVRVTFYAMTNQSAGCSRVDLDNVVMSFSVRSPQGGTVTVYHDAFLADVGHAHWNSIHGSAGPRHIYHSNGAIYSGAPDAFVLDSPLTVAPPRDFTSSTGTDSTGMFVRIVKFDGSASFSGVQGGQRSAVFFDFVGTYTLTEQDDIDKLHVYLWGPLRDATYQELKDTTAGYRFVTEDAGTPADASDDWVSYTETAKPFRFSAAYTLIEVEP